MLSDTITSLVTNPTPEAWELFFEELLRSKLGIIAIGLPPNASGTFQTQGGVSCAMTGRGGKRLLLSCADPLIFRQRYPDQGFNADLDARAAFSIVLANPDCDGLLVNSAASAHSVPITRAQITAVDARKPAP
jgi:hypothetical protein